MKLLILIPLLFTACGKTTTPNQINHIVTDYCGSMTFVKACQDPVCKTNFPEPCAVNQ